VAFVDRLKHPCPGRADRTPNADGWHCRTCAKDVVDLSRLTKRQAAPLLAQRVCIHVELDARGEPVFAPEPDRSLARKLALAGALAIGCASSPPPEPKPQHAAGSVLEPTSLPVGVASDELDSEMLAAWDTPPEQEGPEKILPRPVPQPPPYTQYPPTYDGLWDPF
jgi:hypothetical protein